MKSLKSRITIFPILLSLIATPITARCPHHHKPITKQIIKPMPLSQYSQDGITVTTRALNKEEIHKLFKGRGTALFSRKDPIIPLQISITNKSDEAVFFNPLAIDIKLATEKEILKRLQYNTPARTAIFGVLLLASVPLCLYSYIAIVLGSLSVVDEFLFVCVMASTNSPGLVIGASTVTGTLLCVTSTTYGYSLHRTNKKIAAELKRNITNGMATIQPHSEQSFILFADGNELHNFDIVVHQNAEQDLIFPVTVN